MDHLNLTPEQKGEFLAAFINFFGSPANCNRGACVLNSMLTQIEEAGGRPRFTAETWARVIKSFELHNVPGPFDHHGAAIAKAPALAVVAMPFKPPEPDELDAEAAAIAREAAARRQEEHDRAAEELKRATEGEATGGSVPLVVKDMAQRNHERRLR